MGRDKAQLTFRGRPLIEHALAILAQAGLPARIAGAPPPARVSLEAFAPIIEDASPGLGPLSGICAALAPPPRATPCFSHRPASSSAFPAGFPSPLRAHHRRRRHHSLGFGLSADLSRSHQPHGPADARKRAQLRAVRVLFRFPGSFFDGWVRISAASPLNSLPSAARFGIRRAGRRCIGSSI